MIIVLTIIHVIVCLVLIGVVLLQSGQSADIAGAFGGAGSQTAFGTRGGATLLSKVTTVCAVIFMCTSLMLSMLYSRRMGIGGNGSVLQTEKPSQQPTPPAKTPATPLPVQQQPR